MAVAKNEFTQFIHDELERVKELFAEKQGQYATQREPLENFVRGAALQYTDVGYALMYEVAKGYLNKHIAFLYSHGVVDKTEESLRDMVLYGLIMLYLVKKERYWQNHGEEAETDE